VIATRKTVMSEGATEAKMDSRLAELVEECN